MGSITLTYDLKIKRVYLEYTLDTARFAVRVCGNHNFFSAFVSPPSYTTFSILPFLAHRLRANGKD